MLKRLYYIILQRLYVLKYKNKPCQGKVYMFHNVNDDHDTYSITKDNFESFLNYLINDRKIVDIKALVEEKDPDNVVITFDDVCESVYKNAYPLLKEKEIPFYLFVCNEFLDQENYLKHDQLREMIASSKAIIGSHNMKHELCRFVEPDVMKQNLERSRRELEENLDISVDSFAFPFGSMYACSKENIETAQSSFEYVFMTYPLAYHEEHGRVIPRINMNDFEFKKEMK